MRIRWLFALIDDKNRNNKIKRDAFLYLDPDSSDHTFAQCQRCRSFNSSLSRCAILGPDVIIKAQMSCGFFVPGTVKDKIVKSVTPEQAGLVNRPVRCENCRFFTSTDSTCGLYAGLNKQQPDKWDLDIKVNKQGCCNAQLAV